MKKYLIIIGLMASLTSTSRGQEKLTFAPIPGLPFVYTSTSLTTEIPDVSDSLFNASAKGIRFDVNRTELRPTEPFIGIVRNQLAPILKGKGLVLRKIIVRGAASPEGPYDNNRRLGQGRTARLIEFINSELGLQIDPTQIQSDFISEDYEYLAIVMEKAGDKDAATVRRIWLKCQKDERQTKKALMALNGGRNWQRWKARYFPQLRQARVMMWFGVPVEEIKKAEQKVILPEPTVIQDSTEVIRENKDSISFVPVPVDTVVPKQHRLPLIAIRTNLVHDFFYMPNYGFAPSGNIQLEYFPLHGHYTYNAGFTFSNHRHWNQYKFFQVRDLQLEVRRYFKEGIPYRGAYLGVYAHGFAYGIGFNHLKGWEGEGGGAGISGGYTFKLIRSGHLRMELMAAIGAFFTKYDPYIYGNPLTGEYDGKYYYDYHGNVHDFKKRDHSRFWIGPTNVGVQLTYDLIYRKKGGKK